MGATETKARTRRITAPVANNPHEREAMNRLIMSLVVASLGCIQNAEQQPQWLSPITEQTKGLAAPIQRLGFAADCTQYEGNSGCASGLCLRVLPGLPPKGICSQRCTPGDACPSVAGRHFECNQIWPSRDGWVCAPSFSKPELSAFGVNQAATMALDGSVP